MALVTRASQFRFLMSSSISSAAKSFSAFSGGSPSGFSNPARIRKRMWSGAQLSSQAACSTVSRAGTCRHSDKKKRCSSHIRLCRRLGRTARPVSPFQRGGRENESKPNNIFLAVYAGMAPRTFRLYVEKEHPMKTIASRRVLI